MERNLHFTVTLRLYGEEKCFGPGIAELLERVESAGSLRKATMDMGMAYSKAWKILKTAEENLGFPLLHSVTGGKGGGGAALTEEGRSFLARYRGFEQCVKDYAAEAFYEMF